MSAAFEAQNQELQHTTRISILEAQLLQIRKDVDLERKRRTNAESAFYELETNYSQLKRENEGHREAYSRALDAQTDAEKRLKGAVSKEESVQMSVQIDRLQTQLVEARAAMNTFRKMFEVVGSQCESLKITYARRKDEQESLRDALRELQSENDHNLKVGHLFQIVMLSRWQEAAANKKYQGSLVEIKGMRGDLLSIEGHLREEESLRHDAEKALQEKNLLLDKFRLEIENRKSQFLTLERAEQLNTQMRNIADEKAGVEQRYLKMHSELVQMQIRMEEAQARMLHAEDISEMMKNTKATEVSNRLIELSEKLSKVRLSELRATREAQEKDEKNNYFQRLIA